MRMRTSLLVALSLACTGSAAAAAPPRALTLADAVELALGVEPTVAEARIGKDRSKLAVLRAQLDRISVKIDGSLAEQWNKVNVGGTGASPESGLGLFNLATNLNVPIFTGFRVDATVKRAQRLDDAAGATIRQARRDTALATARAYWSVRRLGLLYDVQQAQLARLRESEAVTQARVQAGLAPPIDHNRAVLRRLQTEAALYDLAGQLHEATVQLAVALGVADELTLVDAPDVPDVAPPPVDALVGDAHGGRPEILFARLQTAAQVQTVRIARSGWFPQLGAQLLFQYGNNPFISGSGSSAIVAASTNPFANTSGSLTLSIGATYNFFDTLHTWTATRDAAYEEARLHEEERRALRLVESDVRLAHAKVNHYWSTRAPLAAARDVARDNATILEARYKNGDALVIELLDAQVALVDAERALADVSAQLKLAWLELDAALGHVVGEQK
jgi:outer membrane protein